MASPRSMWSGTISLGLLNIPVTIGKSWADEREPSLRDCCSCHGLPIDRTERCTVTNEPPQGKQKGVEFDGEQWKLLSENEYADIENATKSDSLSILDVQPAYDLPLEYGTGTYYVRHDKKAKGVPIENFSTLVATLAQGDRAAVVKWCRNARQKLAVLHVQDGLLLLTTIPFASELREAGDQEKAHHAVKPDPALVTMMGTLFDAVASEGFDHEAYKDEGLRLRAEAVEKILSGEKMQEKPKPKENVAEDLMAALRASIAEQKSTVKDDEKAEV